MDSLIKQFIKGNGPEAYLDRNALREFTKNLATRSAEVTDKQKVENFNKLLSAGSAGIATLDQIEGDYEILNIFRDTLALDFMETRPLPLGSLPIFRTKTLNAVNTFMGSLAGGSSTHNYVSSQAGQSVIPFTFTTERVMTPNLNNLYDLEKLGLRKDANDQLQRYMDIAYTNIALNTILGQPALADPAASIQTYAAAGGSFAGQSVYSLDPGVPTAAVPSVNYYDLTTEGGLTKTVFRTLNTHSIQIGRNFNRMYIPQAAVGGKSPVWESLQNLATPVALITGSGLNNNPAAAVPHEMWSEFQKEDFRGEVVIEWFGQRISIRKLNFLPAGYCLCFSDKPAGVMWDRLNLEGPPTEGVLETPVDGFYSYKQKSKNIATLRAGFHLRNFAMLKVQ